jgi:aspartate kinase
MPVDMADSFFLSLEERQQNSALTGRTPAVMYTRLFAARRGKIHFPSPRPSLPMPRLVMKFGGTSVATVERIRNVARHVKREVEAGYDVAVVVSAMAGKTNELVGWVKDASALYDSKEYDVVVASGEQVTSGLLALALQEMGLKARSWQGWQIPIMTSEAHGSARIAAIDGTGIIRGFTENKEVAVVSGFQGMHQPTQRITTL